MIGQPLTPRQREAMTLLVSGLDRDQIADAMGTSPHTVHHHLSCAYRSLGVSDRAHAAVIFDRHLSGQAIEIDHDPGSLIADANDLEIDRAINAALDAAESFA